MLLLQAPAEVGVVVQELRLARVVRVELCTRDVVALGVRRRC